MGHDANPWVSNKNKTPKNLNVNIFLKKELNNIKKIGAANHGMSLEQ
jgi:hypothetical protein